MLANRMMMKAAAVGGGGIDAYTVLMAHMNGTDNAQVFTDSSDSEHTMTANGNVKTENTQKKFGETSAYFDGSGDYISIPASSDFVFGTGNWTIDAWVNTGSSNTEQPIITYWDQVGGGRSWLLDLEMQTTPNRITLYYSVDGTNYLVAAENKSDGFDTNTWYHIAVVRSSNTLLFFVAGVQLGSGTSFNVTLFDPTSSTPLVRAGAIGNGSAKFNGYIDELRISKGIARWTGNFTPPSAPYS